MINFIKLSDVLSSKKKNIKDERDTFEKNAKDFNKSLTQKDKLLYDLEKENKKFSEDLQHEQREFATFKSQVNKERKDVEKSRKKNAKKEF